MLDNKLSYEVSFNTVYFEDTAEGTKITVVSLFQSNQDREAMISSGMERGMSEGYERHQELLAK